MPRFEPFAGVRYDADRVQLDDVIAPPYDIISAEEQAALEARSEYNSVQLELPRDQAELDRYQWAARLFRLWQGEGVLSGDRDPTFYGYRMVYTDESGRIRQTVGVIGALGLETPGHGDVWPHEQTTPKDKSDRLQLLRATHVNMSPIWGLSLATGLSELLAAPTGETGLEAHDDDGVSHQYWPITDPAAIEGISNAVKTAPVVIADGHHRYETALAYQTEHPDEPGAAAIMMLLVELIDDQLSVRPIHRLITGLPDDFDLTAALGDRFELTPTAPPDPTIPERLTEHDSLALVTPEGTWLLKPRATEDKGGDQLDSSTLAAALKDFPAHDLTFQPGWDLATAAVDKGTAQAAVLLRPATVAQIAATGRGGQRMPPKTTYFWPKPRTGLVFREVHA